MKNKNLLNIILIISVLIYTGIAIEATIVRNLLVFGIASGLTAGLLYALSIAFLIGSVCIKKKLWAMLCRIPVIAWLAFVFITSFSSSNEDATVVAVILIILAALAMVFGVLRHKRQNKDNYDYDTK